MSKKEILVKTGVQFWFGDNEFFNPADDGTNWRVGEPTTKLLDLSGLANGAARQSNKCDFGATRAARCVLLGCVDFTGETPVAGKTVDYYLAPSVKNASGEGNVAGNSGLDGACPSGALGGITLAEFLKLCLFIGSLTVHDGVCVQNGLVGMFSLPTRWGQLVVVNNSGDAFEADGVDHHQVINFLVDELQ